MTDQTDYRRVKEVEAQAKNLGFKIHYRPAVLTLWTTKKGLPSLIYGKEAEVYSAPTIEELRAFMVGWWGFRCAMDYIELDEEEYKKRRNDVDVMETLKGKKR